MLKEKYRENQKILTKTKTLWKHIFIQTHKHFSPKQYNNKFTLYTENLKIIYYEY